MGKGLGRLIRIHQTTSPLQRPTRAPTKGKITEKSWHICSEQEPTIQKTIPQIKKLNSPLSYTDFKVYNSNEVKEHLEEKVELFRSQSYTG